MRSADGTASSGGTAAMPSRTARPAAARLRRRRSSITITPLRRRVVNDPAHMASAGFMPARAKGGLPGSISAGTASAQAGRRSLLHGRAAVGSNEPKPSLRGRRAGEPVRAHAPARADPALLGHDVLPLRLPGHLAGPARVGRQRGLRLPRGPAAERFARALGAGAGLV